MLPSPGTSANGPYGLALDRVKSPRDDGIMGRTASRHARAASTEARCAIIAVALLAAACSTSVDETPRLGLITITEMRVERVVPAESALLFADVFFRNNTSDTVNNFGTARFFAGPKFEFNLQPLDPIIMGCTMPDAWDIPPTET